MAASAPDNPDNGDDRQTPEAPEGNTEAGVSGGNAPWYSWRRWRYIGGGMFLLLTATGVGYVIWDVVDLLPRPITVDLVRAALRDSPGRIADMAVLAGLISFGPPAGVDLMFGAAAAARQWARKMQEKDKEEGKKEGLSEGRKEGLSEGRKEGLKEGRKEIINALRARANGNAELHRLLDEIENEGE